MQKPLSPRCARRLRSTRRYVGAAVVDFQNRTLNKDVLKEDHKEYYPVNQREHNADEETISSNSITAKN